MAKSTEQATIHECDGCGSRFVQIEGDELPLGYYGTVTWIHGAGGDGADWFACKQVHIVKAIHNAMSRRD